MSSIHRNKIKKKIFSIFAIVIILVLGIIFISPFTWILSTSFRDVSEAYKLPPRLIPDEIHFRNYYTVINSEIPFLRFFLNSIKITSIVLILQLMLCSLAGYAFARLKFPGKKILFMIILGSMMIPFQVTVIPIYIVMSKLNLVNSHTSIILLSITSAFGVFLLRQFFLSIPKEIEESGRIDGASNFLIFWRLMLPQASAALATLGILTFNASWNDYFKPLLFLNEWSKMTMPLGISALQSFLSSGNQAVIMAAVILAILPVFIFFLLGQNFFIEGMTVGSVKG